jgi:UDP-galactopyranose mutase
VFDYLVVGCGLFGSTFARLAAEKDKKVLIVEKRYHIGGNCFTENICGIDVHKYGAHIFHTNNDKVWNFVNRFAKFNNYIHRVKVNFSGKIYSFPINLMTLYQMWGVDTPQKAIDKIDSLKLKIDSPKNFEECILSQVGEEIYETFIKSYTTKQWNKDPKSLPSSLSKRLPIRFLHDDRYFTDKYQGVPIEGYTKLFENMLDHKNIKFETNVDFFENKTKLMSLSNKIVYTGEIDKFYDYRFGKLEYRSLNFTSKLMKGDYQGCSVINYTDKCTPFTRIIEHKHFYGLNNDNTVVTWEYPKDCSENDIPYYPVNNDINNSVYRNYSEIKSNNLIFGGRLGKYQYMDMHQVIASAIKIVDGL